MATQITSEHHAMRADLQKQIDGTSTAGLRSRPCRRKNFEKVDMQTVRNHSKIAFIQVGWNAVAMEVCLAERWDSNRPQSCRINNLARPETHKSLKPHKTA
jgi:hypothetical protein